MNLSFGKTGGSKSANPRRKKKKAAEEHIHFGDILKPCFGI